MAQQTAVEWLYIWFLNNPKSSVDERQQALKQSKQMEHEQIKQAVMYGLDEDGHTGSWKNSVAEKYYIKTYTDENNS